MFDPQNSMNQFEDNYQPQGVGSEGMKRSQEDEDDLPLLEDMGIGNKGFFLFFLDFWVI